MLRHSYDDSLPFCGDDCTACRVVDLVRWGYPALTAAERRGDPVDEPYYDEVPGDPTDRAAYYARREAREAADAFEADEARYARTASLSRAFRSTFDHDFPGMDYDS